MIEKGQLEGKLLKNKRHIRKKDLAFDIVLYVIMALILFCFIAPIWLLFMASLSDNISLTLNGYSMWFQGFSFEGYKYLFEASDVFLHSILVSVEVSVGAALISLVITALAGYALSKPYLPFRKFFNFLFAIPMFFSGGAIPLYLVIRGIGLYNSVWALILPMVFSGYNLILMRKYFTGIDLALEEAASIDGAGHFKIFTTVYLPLSVPICISVAFMVFVTRWNGWVDNLMYVTAGNEDLWTLQYVLRQIMTDVKSFTANDDTAPILVIKNAAVMASVIPVIIVSPFIQKFFTNGITAGAVKG